VKEEVFPVLVENLKPVEDFDIKQETTLFALSSLSRESELKLSTEKREEILSKLQQIISKNKQSETCEVRLFYISIVMYQISYLLYLQDMVNYARNIFDNLSAH